MDDNKVAVLLEDLMSKFNTFGDGLESLREEMNRRFDEVDKRFVQNHQEHQQIMLMVKELDHEMQVEIKRVK